MNEKKKPNYGEMLYTAALATEVISTAFHATMFEFTILIFTICSLVPLMLVLVKLFVFDRKNVPFVIVGSAILLLANYVNMTYFYQMPLDLAVVVVGAYGVRFEKIAKIYLYGVAAVVGAALIASLCGLIPNLQYEDYRGVRNSFGIVYPTDFAAHIFFLMLAFVFVYWEKLKIYHYIIGLFLSLTVYYFCKTRIDVGCMLLLWLGAAVIKCLLKNDDKLSKNKFYKIAKKVCGIICIFSMPAAAVIMISLTALYNPSNAIMSKINDFSSDRLALGLEGLKKYSITLFGQSVEMHGYGGSITPPKEYFFLDCSYLYCLLQYGLVLTALIIGASVVCGIKYRHSGIFLFITALISLNCMIAHHLPAVEYDIFTAAVFASGGLTLSECFPRSANKISQIQFKKEKNKNGT